MTYVRKDQIINNKYWLLKFVRFTRQMREFNFKQWQFSDLYCRDLKNAHQSVGGLLLLARGTGHAVVAQAVRVPNQAAKDVREVEILQRRAHFIEILNFTSQTKQSGLGFIKKNRIVFALLR